MTETALPPPVWINTAASLDSLGHALRNRAAIAVDTESNSLHAYRERTCLIQVSTPDEDYLVDPLALADISPLAAVLANPSIEKVFHAVEYDLACLKRDFKVTLVHLFDTMQASRILGYKNVGLDSMLQAKFGIKLEKKYQKADWGKRPLSAELLNYARLDTHHLLPLRDCLLKELEDRDLWELAEEEFIRLGEVETNGKPEIPAWQRVKRIQMLPERQLTILQELCLWREKQAQMMDRPPFKVLDDARLVALAISQPRNMAELGKSCLTPSQFRAYGKEIQAALARGRNAPLIRRPRSIRPRQAILDRINALSEWRKTAGKKVGMESDIILPKAWLLRIAEKNPGNLENLALLMPKSPWKLAHFGEQILGVIHSQTRD